MAEVVLFVGAPFSGKTLYYKQSLETRYSRISAAEVYASDPHANLRIVVQKVVALLKKNHNVVIDDENSERQTRLSFLNGISKKIPDTVYSCFQFVSSAGTAQLHICKEWVRGRQFLASLQCNLSSACVNNVDFHCASSRIESHSTDTIDLNLDLDRFKCFKKVMSPLVCFSSYKLTSPLLLLEWEAMVEVIGGERCLRKGVYEAVSKWTAANGDGNVAVLYVTEGAEGRIQHKELSLLHTLVEKVPSCSSLHYVIVKNTADYGRPPRTGLVVWIGYLFAASVHHKSSLYVHQSKYHQICAEELLMKNISAKRLFARPRSVNTVHYSEHEVHHILQKVIHINPDSHTASPSSSQSTQPPSSLRILPLYTLAKQLEESEGSSALHATWSTRDCRLDCQLKEEAESSASDQLRHVSADDGNGRVLGMVYTSFESLKRSQQIWQRSLQAVTNTMVDYASEGEGRESPMIKAADQLGSDLLQEEANMDFPLGSVLEEKAESGPSKTEPAPSESRSLPVWIRETSQDSSSSQTSSSQTKCAPKQSRKTRYRMTESDLLKTAVEYITEAKGQSSLSEQQVELSTEKGSIQPPLEPQDQCMDLRASEQDVLPSNRADLSVTDGSSVKSPQDHYQSDSFLDELFM